MSIERDILLDLPGLLKQAALKPDVVLQPHQERIEEEAGPGTRKLLYHTLGSGKTLSAIAAAEAMKAPYGAVVPAALRANFEKERAKFTDKKRKSDTQSYTMLSKGVEPVHDKTVIFDEAHRLRNPKSKQTIAAKDLASKAQQLYLLSGSPIVNAPSDMAPLVEMLTQQPMSTEKFDAEFLGSERIDPSWWQRFRGMKPGVRQYLKQPRKFNKLLKGKVDYHQPATPSVKRIDEDIFVDMGPEQQLLHKAFYNEIPRSLQRKLEKNFPLSKSEAKNLLAFLSGPRQAALSTHPWLSEKQRVAAGISQAPKLQRAMSELEKQIEADPKSRTVVFSNFIEAGLKPYAAALEAKKIPYGIFHGGLTDKQRADVVNKYNSGELRALLLGPAASEGISLSGTNLMQLLDPHWNESRLEQAVGRGIRFDSHGHLPKEEQKVRVQRYISQLPQGRRSVLSGFKRPTRDTADTFLQNYAHEKQRVNDLFLKRLRQIGTPKQAEAVKEEEEQSEYAEALAKVKKDMAPYMPALRGARLGALAATATGFIQHSGSFNPLKWWGGNLPWSNPEGYIPFDKKWILPAAGVGLAAGVGIQGLHALSTRKKEEEEEAVKLALDREIILDLPAVLKRAEYRLEDQTFTDSDGAYNVAALYELAKAKGKPQNLKISDLLHNLEPSPEEEGEELPGHPDFVTRAEAAGTLPGVVVDYPDGRWVADGVHRLWKARQDKKKEYPAYVLNKSDLASLLSKQDRPLDDLLAAKKESDRRNYPAKHDILRKLIKQSPGDFMIDSEEGNIYGVTHIPTGFRIHMPRSEAPSGLQKRPTQDAMLAAGTKQALDRDIILDLPAVLKRASSFLQSGSLAPRGNPTMRSLTANTPAEGFFGEYGSVGEWANELPNTALTRPSEGPFWKGDVGSTLTSWAGRGMKRKVQDRDHATQFRDIQAAIERRKVVDSRNRAGGAAVQNQSTTSVDSPWGKQAV
jgi:superfamily II DNA or RNA helicase